MGRSNVERQKTFFEKHKEDEEYRLQRRRIMQKYWQKRKKEESTAEAALRKAKDALRKKESRAAEKKALAILDAADPTMHELLEPSDVKIEPGDFNDWTNISVERNTTFVQHFQDFSMKRNPDDVKLYDNQVETTSRTESSSDCHLFNFNAIKSEPPSPKCNDTLESDVYHIEPKIEVVELPLIKSDAYFVEYDNETYSTEPEVITSDPLDIACSLIGPIQEVQTGFDAKCLGVVEKARYVSPPSLVPISTSECRFCKKPFKQRRSLMKHENSHINRLLCPYCDMTFGSNEARSEHVKWTHSDSRFKCTVCEHVLGSLFTLKKHMEIHGRADEVVQMWLSQRV